MELVRSNQKRWRANSDHCFVHEFPMSGTDSDVALIEVDGRYPDTGAVGDQVCAMTVFVRGASDGRITIDGAEHDLNRGDVLRISPGELYWWEGKLHLVVFSTPAWTKEQHQHKE